MNYKIESYLKLKMVITKKITKNQNGENVPHLEITEVVSVHCNVINNDYQQDSRDFYAFVPHKPLSQLSKNFYPKILYF